MTTNNRHKIKSHTKAIWEMSNAGVPQREITKALNLGRGVVSGAVNRGRKSGHCNQKVKTKGTVRNSSPLNYGYVNQIIDALSVDQLEWLLKVSEEVGYKTCAEYVAELVQDAYEEAHQKENNQ